MEHYGFRYGLRRSLTIVLGYAPVAVTFGLLATRYGISFWEAGLMSLLVFAGVAFGMFAYWGLDN